MVAYIQAEQDDDLHYVNESSGKESSSGKEDSGLVPAEVSEHSAEHSEGHSYKAEVIAQIRLAAPVCCTFLMRKSVDIVSVMFVGRLGSHYLSAAGIAAVTSNVSGNSMIVGLAGALSTICSQAYGSKDMVSFSVAPQRAVLILAAVICIPVSVLWLFSSPVMVALGQSTELADAASKYLMVLIPSLWALSFSICIQNWLHAQSKTRAIAIITFIVAIFHPLWCYTYIYTLKLGYLGAALAVTTSKCSELSMLIGYIYFFSIGKETNFQFTTDCFSGWGPFLCLGLPNMLMMGEWWASEAIIFMAGSLAYPESQSDKITEFENTVLEKPIIFILFCVSVVMEVHVILTVLAYPESQVSAMSIYQNTLSICFMIPSSFHVAASTRVGNNLGAAQPTLAKMAAYVSPALALGGTLITSFSIFLSRSRWAYLFTNDIVVVEIVVSILPVLVLYVVTDGVQSALTGVLKGLGKQRIAGPVVLFAYYVIGLPLSYFLAFPCDLGVIGLCIGTTIGTFVHMVLYLLIVARTNWSKESHKVQYTLKKEAFRRKFPTVTYAEDSGSENGSENVNDKTWREKFLHILSLIGLVNSDKSLLSKSRMKSSNDAFDCSEIDNEIDGIGIDNENNGRNGRNGKNVNNINNSKIKINEKNNLKNSNKHSINSENKHNNSNNSADNNSMYRKISSFLGLKEAKKGYSEYELVQSCTDSLNADLENDLSGDEENEGNEGEEGKRRKKGEEEKNRQ